MMRYAPQTAEVLRTVLDGLDPDTARSSLKAASRWLRRPWLIFAPSTLGPRICV